MCGAGGGHPIDGSPTARCQGRQGNWPLWQTDHGVQESALVVAENLLALQAWHVRSVVAVGAATEFGPASFIIAGFVAVWLLLGSLATPIVMQALFCSGSPMSSVVGHAAQFGLGAMGLSRFGGGDGGGGG